MYLGTGKVPAIWEDSSTDCIVNDTSIRGPGVNTASSGDDEDEDKDNTKPDDSPEKKSFLDSLYGFMEDKGIVTFCTV